ncbi:hypothetical protein ON010_g16291 [Phytophthora cinnamomi]|nr:hypothetical protein ON010_g16291 [Phytophthora cinnamomi]
MSKLCTALYSEKNGELQENLREVERENGSLMQVPRRGEKALTNNTRSPGPELLVLPAGIENNKGVEKAHREAEQRASIARVDILIAISPRESVLKEEASTSRASGSQQTVFRDDPEVSPQQRRANDTWWQKKPMKVDVLVLRVLGSSLLFSFVRRAWLRVGRTPSA